MSDIDVAGLIGSAGKLIEYIAKALGETTEEVAARVVANCKATAADPSDETDKAADSIDADMPKSER